MIEKIKKLLSFIKENWFKLLIIIFLIMIYVRLGIIQEYIFNNWDTTDAGFIGVQNTIEDLRSSIDDLRIDLNYR